MNRIGRLICITAIILTLAMTAGVSAQEKAKLLVNTPDEPLAKEVSLARTAAFLDNQSLAWTQQRKCGTCHTNYPYLLARPLLKEDLTALKEVRQFFEDRIANWDSDEKTARPRNDAEVVGTAATLALQDARTTGKLHPLTRKALDRMWTLQKPSGGWEWIKCNWPPLEHDDYYGTVYAAVGVGHAPDGYAQGESAKEGLEKLRKYFKTHPAPSLHHKAVLLWASQKLEGLITDKMRESIIKELLAVQRADGGWSLPTLGDWTAFDERPNDRMAPSDGYATGFVVFILRQAGVPAANDQIQKGVGWLKKNQRESGRWFTRSLNTDRYHFITHAGTAYAVMALKACEAVGD